MDLKLLPLHGLWTDPGALSVSPLGSMRTCDNIVFRELGLMEPLPADEKLRDRITGGAYLPRRIFDARPNKSLVVAMKDDDASEWTLNWMDTATGVPTAVSFYGSVLNFDFDPGRVQSVYFPGTDAKNGYRMLNSAKGLIFSIVGNGFARKMGLSPPMGFIQTVVLGSGRAYAFNTNANVRAIFRRVFDDSFYGGSGTLSEWTSPPSTPQSVNFPFPATSNVQYRIGWADLLDEIELFTGSKLYVELYRTKTVPNTQEPGDRMFLVKSVQLQAGDITNRYVDILDDVTDDELGTELYTNRGQEGIEQAHYIAPWLYDITEFKGTIYGIAPKERHSVTLSILGPWGTLVTSPDRIAGIGKRQISGVTLTFGSPVVTGVPAAGFEGIDVGQVITDQSPTALGFPAGSKVASFNQAGNTITMDQNCDNAAPTQITLSDQIKIDGVEYTMADPKQLLPLFHAQAGFHMDVQFDQPLPTPYGTTLFRGLGFTLQRPYADSQTKSDQFGVTATNGARYSPPLPALASGSPLDSSNDEEQARFGWCRNRETAHWPLENREALGSGTLVRMVATAETMYAFTSEGRIYRISGSPGNEVVDVIRESTYLAGPYGVDVYGGAVYAWTNDGVLEISDSGIRTLSPPIRRDLLVDYSDIVSDQVGNFWASPSLLQMERFWGEIWLRTKMTSASNAEGPCLIYSLVTGEWSRSTQEFATFAYNYDDRRLVFIVINELGNEYDFHGFYPIETDTKRSDAHYVTNRIAAGEPGVLKQLREIVHLFRGDPSGQSVFTADCRVYTDAAAGGGDSTVLAEPFSLIGDLPTPHKVAVGHNAALLTQFLIEFQQKSGNTPWQMDGLIARLEMKVDRTGSKTNAQPSGA